MKVALILLCTVFGYADTIYNMETYSKDGRCIDLNITENEILSLIENGQTLTKKNLNEEFEKSPCEVNGKIKVNNEIINFQYNFANYIRVNGKVIGCYSQFKGCSEQKEKKRIEVKKIFEITNDNSTYKINCKMYKKLDASTIKKYFLHSIKEPRADQIRSNETPWSGCVQKGEIFINEKLYTFELNLGGFGYMHSKDGEGTGYNCYHIGCPKFQFDYGLKRINNPTYKSLYSFCKSTGIKESEIRKLNPWINKDATNILADAEIVVPNINNQ